MAQVINTNSLSLITQNNINKNQSALSTSIERLSSGLRINSAKDDAAGQAIANRFTSNIKGLTQAARNANDGISLAQTAEGALSEINNNLQRIRELTVQASTGTNSDSDLSSIQDEIKSRLDEIDRVSGQTQFNGVNVLSKNDSMKIQIGANDNQTISIGLQQIDSTTLNLKGFTVSGMADFSAAKLTAADGTAIAAADVKDAGGKQVNLLSYTDTASNSTKYAVVDSATGKYMEATVVITGTAAAVTVGAAEVAERLCDDHKQGSRHTFARHVRDHHCQMSLVHQKEIVKVSPHLLGRLHGCIDVKFRPVWEGRENARQHAGLDMGGHVQFRPDAFLFRCHS